MQNLSWIRKSAVVFALALLGAAVWLVLPADVSGQAKIKKGALEQADQELYPKSEYGWLTYYMHEVYERYIQAKEAYKKGDMDMARANLVVMEIFSNLSKDYMPDKLQDGKPFDKEAYKKSINRLNSYSEQIRKNLEKGKWADQPKGEMDPMMKTCVGCHAEYNIPTDFRINTKFKVLTHSMHEIYELYKQAGPFLQQEEWEKARYCLKVVDPYIESIPKNIPEKNQDGEPIDKELFTKTYKNLKQYNGDMVKRLKTRSWEGGKPLPPPRIVVDNCYACHSKVAKIPSPW